ncbi:uncharacterized protein KD926_003141 [Aspergillus affinis]|uniref:uncharacterized protein n=1 Tax=Aspergillus affinis TaxID=1070780 RepID=UPI0022FF44DD|nr:uncharacterized protein KD926_003141 [Aspergillus affinis]KAI9035663.1 hypothetical protein KD926_003141 [Aspergillus affinis]
MRKLVFLSTLLLPQYGLAAVNDQVNADLDYGSFESPSSRIRPRFRYWLPDASVNATIVQENIKSAGAIGAGGVEFVPYYNYGESVPEADWSKYGFGTPDFVDIFEAALRAHKDAGMVMDFSIGPAAGQGVPASVDDEGLQWDLSYASAAVPSNGVFNDLVPGWGQGELVAVVSAQVLSSRNLSNPGAGIPIFETQPNYTQYKLKNATLQEWSRNVSSAGQLQSTFDHGSFAVDHYSARGAQTVTRFWEKHILKDEVKSLLAAVGNYGWEDSIEIESNMSWTRALPEIFLKKHGYSLKTYLPLIMYKNNNINIQSGAPGTIQCVLDTPDQGIGYINDFRSALQEGYRAYLQHLTDWANEMSLQFSSQVSYNLPLDALASIPVVNAPECESLQFKDNVDGYRQFAGPAVLTGKRVISNEMGGVESKGYQHSITDLLWQISRAVSGGVNQVVLHGQTYTGDYLATTWPGNTPFWYLFADLFSEKLPFWDHGLSEALNYMGRVQYIQQKGQPKIDVVVYNKDSATDGYWPTVYNETDLSKQGFTYSYLSPDNFALPQAHVKNGSLAPEGPNFRAMVILSSANLTSQAVRDIKSFARAGLPIILSGGLPNAYISKDGNTEGLTREISSLRETSNVHIVSSGKTATQLLDLGITPRVQLQSNGTWYPTWRTHQDGTEFVYLFSDIDESTGNISVATTKRPYIFDTWTGKQTPVLEYEQKAGRTVIPLQLVGNQTVIIGFVPGGNSSPHATQVPSSVIGYKYGNSARDLQVHISADSDDTPLTLSNGKTIDHTTKSPSEPYTLSNWTLTVEHWKRPSNLYDASTIAVKHNTTHHLPSLISWQQIPAIANASGLGYYSTSLTWPPASNERQSADGAYLFLPKTPNGARVFINNNRVPAFDYNAPKIDIGEYLVRGRNEVRVEVPSTMWNYLRTMLDKLKSAGRSPEFELMEMDVPGTVDNGLIGTVRVVPYVSVRVL